MRGCFSYARNWKGGVHVKREYRVCPRGLQMRLGGTIGRRMLLYALCVPLLGGVSPVESENAAEDRTDDLTNRCEDE